MPLYRRILIDGIVLLILCLVQWILARWAMQVPRWRNRQQLIRRVAIASCVFIAVGMILPFHGISRNLPADFVEWFEGGSLLWAFATLWFLGIAFFWRFVPEEQWQRRSFLRTVAAATFSAPLVAEGYGMFVQREKFKVREIDLPIAHLPRDLQGLRIVQLTDIHLSEFLPERDLERVIAMANETRAQVAVMTGDLITRVHDPLDACLRQLARVKTDAGMLGCLGNHEIYAEAEDYTAQEGAKLGVDFLRRQARAMRFGNATLNIAGVDYQPMKKPYLTGAERLIRRAPETVNLLLSHNPDVFPVAEKQGYDAVIAGHTHGGQVTVEILEQYVNAARMYTPYVSGLYRINQSSLYVSPGIGTIGMPVRLGTQPEITVLRLCAS